MLNIKVLHVCTHSEGGAGIAVKRLHNALLAEGLQSKVLTLFSKESNYGFYKHNLSTSKFSKILSYLKRQSIHFKYSKNINKLKGNYECYTLPFSNYYIENLPIVKEADIIHLHWVSGFINYPTFFKNINKPIVWTMHDLNPIMGGFHYKIDFQQNPQFSTLEEKLINIKYNALKNVKNLSVVCLSNYIKNLSENNSILSQFPHYLIPNGIETLPKKIIDKNIARAVFGVEEYKYIFLVVAQNLNVFRKGFDILVEAIDKINLPENVLFIAIGDIFNNLDAKNIKIIPRIQDSLLLEIAYSMADALILPSREDNLPNTMLEALSVGIPVISFKVGGMKDVINNENGILIDNISSEDLKNTILKFVNDNYLFDREKIKQTFYSNYSASCQAKKHIELYKKILNG